MNYNLDYDIQSNGMLIENIISEKNETSSELKNIKGYY